MLVPPPAQLAAAAPDGIVNHPNEAGGMFVGKPFVAALFAAGLAAAVSAENVLGAQAFVAELYNKAIHNPRFSFASPRLLSSDFYELVLRSGGPMRDFDPVCQCRTNDGLSAQIVSVTGSADRALAHVLLRIDSPKPPPPKRVTLVLTRASLTGWKIADVQTREIPSLRARLVRRNAARSRS